MYITVRGIPIPHRKIPDDLILVWIPYMNVKVYDPNMRKCRSFWIDVFFIDKVSRIVRRAALLKKPEKKVSEIEIIPDSVMLKPSVKSCREVYELLYEALVYAYNVVKNKPRVFIRVKRTSKLTPFKSLLVPSGVKEIEIIEDERTRIIRESIWAYEILKEALLIPDVESPRKGYVEGGEIYWYPLLVRITENYLVIHDGKDKGLKVEARYTKLLEVDEKARDVLVNECEKLVRFRRLTT